MRVHSSSRFVLQRGYPSASYYGLSDWNGMFNCGLGESSQTQFQYERLLDEGDFYQFMNSQYFTVPHLISPHEHLVFHNTKVTLALWAHLNGHRAGNLLFTGLSRSGKFKLPHTVEARLHAI